MRSDIERRASDLVEHEEAQAARDKERRDHEHHESRLEEARRRIKEDDARAAAERSRQEAEVEAAELSKVRHELEQRIEVEGASLNRSIAELEALGRRQRDTLRRAGRNPGHDNALSGFLPRWFAHRFGGFNSVTGVPGAHPAGKDRPLYDRDSLAVARTEGEAS